MAKCKYYKKMRKQGYNRYIRNTQSEKVAVGDVLFINGLYGTDFLIGYAGGD